LFFYWLVPEWVTEDEFAAYPQDDRVRYVKVPQHKDRTKEYLTFRDRMDQLLAFNGELWDFDVLLTVRTGLVPLMRLIATSPRQCGQTWLKQFWVVEEMPLMDFKPTVMTIDEEVQDRFTLNGYMAADRVWMISYHEKGQALTRAREFFSPSQVKKLDAKINQAVTSQFTDFQLKTPADFFCPKNGKPFCIAHAGRMEKANRIDEINDLMVKQFVMKGTKVRLLVCTQSRVVRSFDQSVVEVKRASRDEFWSLAKYDMHVLLKLSTESGFNLTLLEPIMFGVPAIVCRAPWSSGLLGQNYPFLVNNETQAYGLVNAFYDNYAEMYERFRVWHETWFVPTYKRRFSEDLLYEGLTKAADAFLAEVPARYAKLYPGRAGSTIIKTIADHVADKQEFVLFDAVRELAEAGNFSMLGQKTDPNDRDRRNLIWSTPWNDIRVTFKHLLGWEDASTTVGHLRRVS
jgi:hypothetical protein